jgi:hypothetical protein
MASKYAFRAFPGKMLQRSSDSVLKFSTSHERPARVRIESRPAQIFWSLFVFT